MTHGVFLSRIQADPELRGVSAVLFDEVHERSLDNDLSLALALDSAGALRDIYGSSPCRRRSMSNASAVA